MDNRSAREMLGALPIKMNTGGEVAAANQAVLDYMDANPDASIAAISTQIADRGADLNMLAESLGVDQGAAQEAFDAAQVTNTTLREQEAAYLANPSSWTPETTYNAIIESGISVQDALDAGVKQSTIDMIFTAPAETPAYSGPAATAPMAEDVAAYYNRVMQDGAIDAAERLDMQKIATDRGLSYADIVAAGVDPNILYQTAPAAKPVTPAPETPPILKDFEGNPIIPFPTGPATPAPNPFPMMPDTGGIYAAGQPALDEAFRASAPRTEVLDAGGNLVGFDYMPAAKLRSATGSGFNFQPPSVTSRPRTLMGTNQLGRYQQGRAAQDLATLTSSPFDANAYNQLQGSYGGLSRSQLFSLMRQQEGQKRAAERAAAPVKTPIDVIQPVYDYDEFDQDGRQTNRGGGSSPSAFTTSVQPTNILRPLKQAEGGPVKKPKGSADGGSASADLKALDSTDPLFIQTEPPFIDRINNPQDYPVINNIDGSVSTHRMAAEVDENGNWYVFPTIQMEDGVLKVYKTNQEAMKNALATGNYLKAPSKEEAIKYAEGAYKKGTELE